MNKADFITTIEKCGVAYRLEGLDEGRYGPEYIFAGLTIRINAHGYSVVCNVVSNRDFVGKRVLARLPYSKHGFDMLADVLLVAGEFARWQTFRGMDAPEIIFAIGENAFFCTDLNEYQRGMLSMHAYYSYVGLNCDRVKLRGIHVESGTRDKFCGVKRNFLPKEKVFDEFFSETFTSYNFDEYRGLRYLSRDTDISYGLVQVRRSMVCTNSHEVESLGLRIPAAPAPVEYHVVAVTREQKAQLLAKKVRV